MFEKSHNASMVFSIMLSILLMEFTINAQSCDISWFEPNINECGISEYQSPDGTVFYMTESSYIITNGIINYYDCDGNLICSEGGFTGETCSGVLDAENLTFVEEIITCSAPCLNGDFSWAEDLLDGDCVCQVDQYIDASGNAVIFAENDCNYIDLVDAFFDCEGNVICFTNGHTSPENLCSQVFVDQLDFVQTLYTCSTTELTCNGIGNFSIESKILLEGLWDGTAMHTQLNDSGLLPQDHPYNSAPWNSVAQSNSDIDSIDNAVDWVLVKLHDEDFSVADEQIAVITTDGNIVNTTEGCLVFTEANKFGQYHLSVFHRNHIGVLSSILVKDGNDYDFTTGNRKAMGTAPMKFLDGAFVLHGGDFDGNGIINNLDFNNWYEQASIVNQYLSEDVDGNGNVNNLDYNIWELNRSRVGSSVLYDY